MAIFPSREVAARVLGFDVRWYGIMYVAAFWLAWWLLPGLARHTRAPLTRDTWTYVVAFGALGTIIGGRLGYALVYEPAFFAAHPLQVFALWHGGMSSHGGIVGAALGLWYVARTIPIAIRVLGDVAAVPAAIGIALGRLGNFINQELYGTPTTLPWGITVPGEDAPVHPAQLYSAAANIVIAGVCYGVLRKKGTSPGVTVGVFFVLYSVQRFVIEFFRMQQWSTVFGLTRGQLLTIPVLVAGMYLIDRAR